MANTWTVEAGKAVWDGRRLVDWLPDVVVELVRAFDVACTDPARFGDHSAIPGTVARAATLERRRLHHRKC